MGSVRLLLVSSVAGGVLVASAPARADDAASEAKVELGAGLAVRDNRFAVGQTEGTAIAIAYAFDLGLRRAWGMHRLSLALHDAQGMSFTPLNGEAVKMVDDLDLRLTYELAPSRFVGALLDVEASAPLLATDDVRSSESTFVVTRPDGTEIRLVGRKLDLTAPLRPLAIRELVGARFSPFTATALALTLDAGLGASEILAGGQRALADEGQTTSVEVIETESSYALGPEIAVGVRGRLDGQRLAYAVETRARLPLASARVRVAKDLGAAARTEVGLFGAVRLELMPWLSLDYTLGLARRPLLTDRVEVVDTILLAARPSGTGLVF